MSTDRDVMRTVRSWLKEDGHEDADRVLDTVLDQLDATPQRRAGWLARRFPVMNNNFVRFGLAAAAVVVIVFLGIRFLLPGQNVGPSGPTPTPTATPPTQEEGPLAAGTYVARPFIGEAQNPCQEATPPCSDPAADDSIRFTFTIPDGWAGLWKDGGVFAQTAGDLGAPDGAGLLFTRGDTLYSDPCQSAGAGDIPIGPTVDDFVSALADHPLLDTTTPVDVTLGGYSGKYLDLHVPSELPCSESYWPWDGGLRAQGPGHQWHLWILDVDGVRVVVQSMEYAGTSLQHQAELQAIVDSIQIEP